MNVRLIWWEPLFSPPHLKAHYTNSQHEYLPMRGPNRSQMHTNAYIIVGVMQFTHKQRSVGPASLSKLAVTLCLLDRGWLSTIQRLYQTHIIIFSVQKTHSHLHAALSGQPAGTDVGFLLPFETQVEVDTHTHTYTHTQRSRTSTSGSLDPSLSPWRLWYCQFVTLLRWLWINLSEKATMYSLAWFRHNQILLCFLWLNRWILHSFHSFFLESVIKNSWAGRHLLCGSIRMPVGDRFSIIDCKKVFASRVFFFLQKRTGKIDLYVWGGVNVRGRTCAKCVV